MVPLPDNVIQPCGTGDPVSGGYTNNEPVDIDQSSQRGKRTMAVPKKKTSKSKTRSRRASAWRLIAPPRSLCPRCGNAKTPHTVCPSCGWYRDRVVVYVG